MDDLIAFLKSAGFPTWAIVGVVVLAVVAKPVTWLIGRIHRTPTMDTMVRDRFEELGRQQGAFFDRLERQAKAAIAEAQRAHEATRRCEAKHEECQGQVTHLETRVGELEKVAGSVREPKR